MISKKFFEVSSNPRNSGWIEHIKRNNNLYQRSDDIRSEFARDYTRILHSNAYRRLKNKTQVFFATGNDHICTRIEHVNHVASVSKTIAEYLGLNIELTNAIASGHDLGHAPFGHEGEKILNEVATKELNEKFWHEGNSLWFIDRIETLPDPEGKQRNLNLTYAVRDGIVLHCGEVDENSIFPRTNHVELTTLQKSGQVSPYTWEGCVVKIADKISYLGRDIEDALPYKILTISQIKELKNIVNKSISENLGIRDINNTVLMHKFIVNLCEQSNPDDGLCFSEEYLNLINSIKKFNYDYIYNHSRLNNFKKYVRLIIESIFTTLNEFYNEFDTIEGLRKYDKIYPLLTETFLDWLIKYSDIDSKSKRTSKYYNDIVYYMDNKGDYIRSILHFISGMTDNFAIKIFNEITSF